MSARNGQWGCHLPSISRATCPGEVEKVPEKRDSGMTKVERSYSAKHRDSLESKECLANRTSSDRRISPPSSDDTAADLGQKSSSSSPSSSTPSSVPASAYGSASVCSPVYSARSPETSLPEIKKEKYPEEFSLLKMQTKDGQRPEWTFYPRFSSNIHTYHVGKQCFFHGVFRGNRKSVSERTIDKTLGRKKYDIDPRNGIPKLTPGDNPYMFPEQSKEFYRAGGTLPPVNFSLVPYEKKFDTFIPLEPLPQIPNLPFWKKEKVNNLKNEIKEVQELDNWQAKAPLIQSLFFSGGFKKSQKIF